MYVLYYSITGLNSKYETIRKINKKGNTLIELVERYSNIEMDIETARMIIKESHLIELMNYRDALFDNDERLYNVKESERREKRLIKRIDNLNSNIKKYGLKIQFYGLPAHIEIYNGSYYMDTYCTL